MRVEFSKSFSKDLDDVKAKSVKESLARLIERMENVDSLQEISNTKKLKRHKNAFKIRIGDYRLGLFYDHPRVTLGRFLHQHIAEVFFTPRFHVVRSCFLL